MINEVVNGSHKTAIPGYFEWWYFHFIADDGTRINIVLHETDIFGLKISPYLSLGLFSQREPKYYKWLLKKSTVVQNQEFLEVSGGIFKESRQKMDFCIEFPKGFRFEGTITRISDPLVINEGILYEDTEIGKRSYWVIQYPRAHFEGTLNDGNSSRNIKGAAYQDHQWGNIKIQSFVSDWVWGNFSNADMSTIFFRVLTQKGTIIDRFAEIKSRSILTDTKLKTSYLDHLDREDSPESGLFKARVRSNKAGAEILFKVEENNLMRKRTDEFHSGFRATYLRWATSARYIKEGYTQDMFGITEYLRIRKERNA